MTRILPWLALAVLLPAHGAGAQTSTSLAPVSAFDHIADRTKRAVALFQEISLPPPATE